MPTTGSKAIPYPVATDTPDVPRDVLALATRVDTLLGNAEVLAPQDLNLVTASGSYALDNATANAPANMTGTGIYVDVSRYTADYIEQTCRRAYTASMETWRRYRIAAAWTPWRLMTPHAEVSGIGSVPMTAGVGSLAVVLPAGMFYASATIAVVATIASGAGTMAAAVVRVTAVASTGFTLTVSNGSTQATPIPVHWIARQDSP